MADLEVFRDFDPNTTFLYGKAKSVVGRAVVVTSIGQLYDLDFAEDQIPVVLTEQAAHIQEREKGSPAILLLARGFLTFGKPTSAEYTHYQTILDSRYDDPTFLGVSTLTYIDVEGRRYGLDHWEIQDFSRPFIDLNDRHIELRRKGQGAELLIRS
jgi:hypothetical protein